MEDRRGGAFIRKWGEEAQSRLQGKETRQIILRVFEKSVGNHIRLYLPKIIYNAYAYLHAHTCTHTQAS